MEKINMDSLVTVLASVEKMGFTTQFEVKSTLLHSLKTNRSYAPDQVKISHFFRFEGESNPDDSAIMYAIDTNNGEKGTLVDGYGTAADSETANFIRNVKNIQK